MRRGLPLVFILSAACGLDVTGAIVDGGTASSSASSSGTTSSSSSSGTASSTSSSSSGSVDPDAGPPDVDASPPTATFCSTLAPPAARCLDFDGNAGGATPFGFDFLDPKGYLTTTSAAKTGFGAGRSLLFAVNASTGGTQDRSGWGGWYEPTYPANKKLTIEADITIEKMTLNYAALVAFRVVKKSDSSQCNTDGGLAANKTSLIYFHGGAQQPMNVNWTAGKSFHFKLVTDATPGGGGGEDAYVDTKMEHANRAAFPSACDGVEVKVGGFNTSQEQTDGLAFRFDNVVMRTSN